MREDGAATERELNAPLVIFSLVVGAILTLALVVALQAVYYGAQRRRQAARVEEGPPAELTAMRGEQEARLRGYRFVDRSSGTVAIPVEQAMDLVLEESRRPEGAQEDPR